MTIEQRVDALERRVTRYRTAMMTMALVLVAGVTMGQTKTEVTDEIRCRKLIVVNERGEPRGEFGVSDNFPELILNNTRDKAGITLSMFLGVPNFTMNGANDMPRVSLNVMMDVPTFMLWDSKEKSLVTLASTDTGGYLSVSNKTGQSIATLMADEYGNGVVGAWNRKGKGRTLQPGP